MLQRISRASLAFAITASLAAGPLAKPAVASTGSTWTMIEAGAALVGGIILYNNYKHKRQAANTIVGYTRNGGRVYGDGRIVMPDGATIYPGRNGQYPWGQAAYYQPNATGYMYAPAPRYGDRDDYRDADDYRDRDNYVRSRHDEGRRRHRDHDRGRHGDRD